jgi:hypothetical protein
MMLRHVFVASEIRNGETFEKIRGKVHENEIPISKIKHEITLMILVVIEYY